MIPLRTLMCAASLVACASSVTAGDASIEDRLDASESIAVRLVVGNLAQTHPGVGFRIRVESSDHMTRDGTTNDRGEFRMGLSFGQPPWSVTCARNGYNVVSIVGVSGSMDTVVRVGPAINMLATGAYATQPVTGMLTSGAAPGLTFHSWVDTFGGAASEDGLHYSDRVIVDPDAPGTFSVIGILRDASTNLLVNGALVDGVARTASPHVVDLPFPSPPRIVHAETVNLRFAGDDLLTPLLGTIRSADVGAVRRSDCFSVDFDEYGRGVGHSRLSSDGAQLAWEIQHFVGDLQPDFARLRFANSAAISLDVKLTSWSDRDSIVVSPVRTLRMEGATWAQMRPVIDQSGYDGGGLVVSSGSLPGRWTIFAASLAALSASSLPTLPGGVRLRDVGLGVSLEVAPWLIVQQAGAPMPWARLDRGARLLASGPRAPVAVPAVW